MTYFKKYKLVFLSLLGLSILYFILRLYHLESLPIFTDEVIYLRWAQIAKNDAAWRFISLTDGKQPSFIWLTIVSMRLVSDPLIAGRIVSVGAGFLSMIGLFFLGKELFKNKWVGVVSVGLYVIFPMALVYDRMALYDTLVAMFCIWGLYVEILLVRYIRLDIALILGFVLGGGMLTKTSAFFTAAFLPFTLLLFDWQAKEKIRRLVIWGVYVMLAVGIGYFFYSILRLSPYFYIIDQKNHEFVLPLSEWIKNPFIYFSGNMPAFLAWIVSYLTIPLTFVLLIGIYFGRKYAKEILFILLCFIIPLSYLAFFGKIAYPRYLLFMATPLLTIIAFAIIKIGQKIRNRMIFSALMIFIIAWPLYSDYLILANFSNAPIPKGEIDQYVNGWPAGGGVKEAIDFFENEAKDKKIYVATQGTFGLMPYALELYLGGNRNIQTQGFWPLQDALPPEVIARSQNMPTYILFYQPCPQCPTAGIAPVAYPLEKVLQVEKLKGASYLTVYKVNSE